LGVSNKTVSESRKDMEGSGELCNLHSSIGADGKERPRQVECKPYRYIDDSPEGGHLSTPLNNATLAPLSRHSRATLKFMELNMS